MKKQVLTVFMAGILTASMSMTALAGWEQEGNNWKYNDNGNYAANGWYWIDGNNDGIAESYYFDNTGILARDTTVEGYTVNADSPKKNDTGRSLANSRRFWERRRAPGHSR